MRVVIVLAAMLNCAQALLPAAAEAGVGSWLKRKVRGAGNAVGDETGNVVDRAVAPTIKRVQGVAKDVLADVDRITEARVDQVGRTAAELVGKANTAVEDRLDQVDRSLTARITQVQTAATTLIGIAGRRVDLTIARAVGRIDAAAEDRIAQVFRGAEQLVNLTSQQVRALLLRATGELRELLRQVDDTLRNRAEQLDGIVERRLTQVDRILQARLEQLDAIAERRLGNVDVIAAKATIQLEAMAARLVALVAVALLLALALWRLFAELVRARSLPASERPRPLQLAARLLPQLVLAMALVAAARWLLPRWVAPDTSAARLQELVADHARGLERAVDALDTTRARYHVAQLRLLRPAGDPDFDRRARKVDLIRRVFERASAVDDAAELAMIEAEIAAQRGLLREAASLAGRGGRAALFDDPDLLVVEAALAWRLAADRDGEHQAALLAGTALEVQAARSGAQANGYLVPMDFALEPLARHYLRAFLRAPPVLAGAAQFSTAAVFVLPEGTRRLERTALCQLASRGAFAAPGREAFDHVLRHAEAVAMLRTASDAALVELLDAHAAAIASAGALRDAQWQRRRRAAVAVDAAWHRFDTVVAADDGLRGTPAAIAALRLDDAPLTYARWLLASEALDEPLFQGFGAHADADRFACACGSDSEPGAGAIASSSGGVATVVAGKVNRGKSFAGAKGRDRGTGDGKARAGGSPVVSGTATARGVAPAASEDARAPATFSGTADACSVCLARRMDRRLACAPLRSTILRRERAQLDGELLPIVEFQEAERFRAQDASLRAFAKAWLTLRADEANAAARVDAARAAAAIGLRVMLPARAGADDEVGGCGDLPAAVGLGSVILAEGLVRGLGGAAAVVAAAEALPALAQLEGVRQPDAL